VGNFRKEIDKEKQDPIGQKDQEWDDRTRACRLCVTSATLRSFKWFL